MERHGKGLYHGIYRSRVEAAIAMCRTLQSLDHSGEKGRIREILIRDLFRPLLRADLGVGTGFVVASDGQMSSQQDIVLYDRAILPPALYDQSTGIFPVESVLYVIEVKSKVTAQEWKSSHSNASALAKFPLLGTDGKAVISAPATRFLLFALATDLSGTGKAETDRYNEIRGTDPPYIGAVCVAEVGYWWFEGDMWKVWPEKAQLSEVVGALAGIMNTLPQVYETRRAMRPPLGTYLIDFGPDLTDLVTRYSACDQKLRAIEVGIEPEVIATIAEVESDLERLQKERVEIETGYSGEKINNFFSQLTGMHQELMKRVTAIRSDLSSRGGAV